MDSLLTILSIIGVVALVVFVANALVGVVTIREYERGLRYTNGRFRGLLPAGTYPYLRALTDIRVLDGRPSWLVIEGQEVPTADGIALKVSLAARSVVGDAVAAVTGDQDHREALRLQLQLALREALAARTFDEALASRVAMGPEIADRAGLALARVGIELLEVQVRDLILPPDLKRAYASVVAARKEGEVALERARSETAALRSLANAGRIVADNPGVFDLRLLQQLGASSGNTVLLGLGERGGGGDGTRVGGGTGGGGAGAVPGGEAGIVYRAVRPRTPRPPASG